jgi:phosphoadenosine phosphosulfate reductase
MMAGFAHPVEVRDMKTALATRPLNAAEDPPRTAREQLREEIVSGVCEARDAAGLLRWAVQHFHPRLVLSCSFGAPEGLVLLDMLHRIEAGSRVFVLDTGRLPQATHDLIDRVRERYGKRIELVFPDARAVEKMARDHGQNLFYESVSLRQHCCAVRKIEPLRRYFATAGIDAWISGLRREQSVTRRLTPKVEIDRIHGGLVKLNPLAAWNLDDVWQYVRRHDVPTNRLHREGYPSVGCEPCSRAVQVGGDLRAGRWWWEAEASRECGLHVGEESDGSGI